MKPISKNVGIVALALVAVSLSGTFAFADDFQGTQLEEQTGGIYGHLEGRVIDENGNVNQYLQTDNRIVVRGTDMLVINTFAPVFTGTIDTTLGQVGFMQIGTLATADTSTTNTLFGPVGGCVPVAISGASAPGADSAGFAQTSPTISATFSGAGTCATTFLEAGLFDGSTGSGLDDMFARGIFATSVTLTASDSLVIDWTFTFTDT